MFATVAGLCQPRQQDMGRTQAAHGVGRVWKGSGSYLRFSTRVATTAASACREPFTSTESPAFKAAHDVSLNCVDALVRTSVEPMRNESEFDAHAPARLPAAMVPFTSTAPSRSSSLSLSSSLSSSLSTVAAAIELSACRVPFTSTRLPPSSDSHVPSRNCVEAVVVTRVAPTENDRLCAAHEPARLPALIVPFTSAAFWLPVPAGVAEAATGAALGLVGALSFAQAAIVAANTTTTTNLTNVLAWRLIAHSPLASAVC